MATEQEKGLRKIAEKIDQEISKLYGERMAFVLTVSKFETLGAADYISNAKREDIIKAMKETAFRLENKQDIPVTEGGEH